MPALLRRVCAVAPAGVLLAFAALYAIATTLAIVRVGWRSPMFDQWRGYTYYLLNDFPASVLQLENGHRPVIPSLLRVFEAWCCGAGQHLQIAVGAGLALAAVALVAVVSLRDRALAWPLRAAAVLAVALGILWLGNARMLMHGNESVHAYLVVTSVMAASLLAGRAVAGARFRSTLAAALLCAVAMFSFGPGVASFGATALVLLLNGGTVRRLWPLVLVFIVALLLYLFVLPGDDGVRDQLLLRPLESAGVAVRWLGAPFAHAWLYAAPGAGPDWQSAGIASAGGALAGPLRSSAAWLIDGAADVPGRVHLIVGTFGALGVAAWSWLTFRLWRRPVLRPLQSLALGTTAFSLATAALISMARLPLFADHPSQILADRYLVWSTLFWSGLVLLLLSEVQEIRATLRRRVLSGAACAAMGAIALLALPSHRQGAGWAVAVNRASELAIVAAWLKVRGELFPDGEDASRADVERSLAVMRARSLGPFALVPPVLPGSTLDQATANCGEPAASGGWIESDGRNVLEVAGECDHLDHQRRWLLVVDQAGVVRGLARTLPDRDPLVPAPATRRRYAGLVPAPAPGARYRVVALAEASAGVAQ